MIFKGDIDGNGMITIEDVALLWDAYVEFSKLTTDQELAADVNGDGVVNITDKDLLFGHIRGKNVINGYL